MKKVTCIDRDKNQHEVPVSEMTFRPAVYAVIIKNNSILLSKQWDGYDLPGGGIEVGETVQEALVREVKEETGLNAQVGKIVTCETSFYKAMYGDCWNSILIYYACEVADGELSMAGADEREKNYIAMPEWIPLEQIEKIKFYNSIDSVKIIKQALELRN